MVFRQTAAYRSSEHQHQSSSTASAPIKAMQCRLAFVFIGPRQDCSCCTNTYTHTRSSGMCVCVCARLRVQVSQNHPLHTARPRGGRRDAIPRQSTTFLRAPGHQVVQQPPPRTRVHTSRSTLTTRRRVQIYAHHYEPWVVIAGKGWLARTNVTLGATRNLHTTTLEGIAVCFCTYAPVRRHLAK